MTWIYFTARIPLHIIFKKIVSSFSEDQKLGVNLNDVQLIVGMEIVWRPEFWGPTIRVTSSYAVILYYYK